MGVHLHTLMDGTVEEKTKTCIFYIGQKRLNGERKYI